MAKVTTVYRLKPLVWWYQVHDHGRVPAWIHKAR